MSKASKAQKTTKKHDIEVINDIRELWEQGKAFFLTGSVSAPYDGCFHEPNIWLVTPEASPEYVELNSNYNMVPKAPDSVVWPLYGSGQGLAVDCIHSLAELESMIEDESIEELGKRENKLGSHNWIHPVKGRNWDIKLWGRIERFSAKPMGPINELGADARYWMHALTVADSHYGLDLTWKCTQCGHVFTGSEYESEPIPTGYYGDGGIGVHYSDVMCRECIDRGMCRICNEQGCNPSEYYDSKVAEFGWSLCEDCTERLLAGCFVGNTESSDYLNGVAPDTVVLAWYNPADPRQLALLPNAPVKKLGLFIPHTIEGKPATLISEIVINQDLVMERSEKYYDVRDAMHQDYGHGLYLSGATVAEIAQQGWEDQEANNE